MLIEDGRIREQLIEVYHRLENDREHLRHQLLLAELAARKIAGELATVQEQLKAMDHVLDYADGTAQSRVGLSS